ncbi:hypothetical protein OEZ85_008008 [Tetradesmus obliquus]|uniref:Uncharacterized protein n=1 Tax=Tetradesmus obliquus TaxID=3088 RepID=A0ABY8THL7_TETOB|nr:hypothetical protein OEZ85_008008 [Tetradesmus obliquus]
MARRTPALAVFCLVAAASVHHAAAASTLGRRGLLQDRIGIKTTRSFEAPQATRWSVGSHTSASGPAVFRTTADFTGPQPPSFAVGVNPSAGYAEVQTKTRMDANQPIPQHSMRAGAYAGNSFVADVSLGGRITPIATGQIKIRPTAPVTLPTFNFGGSVLPTYREQMVINPRAPRPVEATAPKRHLLNYGYNSELTAQAPSTPQVKVNYKPTPAVVSSSTAIRSERPSVVVEHNVPGAVVTASGTTDVKIAPQRSFPRPAGKGSWTMVNLSRQPSTVSVSNEVNINWPSSTVTVSGNNPLSARSDFEATTFNPLKALDVSVRPQNLGARPDGFVQRTSNLNVPIPGGK